MKSYKLPGAKLYTSNVHSPLAFTTGQWAGLDCIFNVIGMHHAADSVNITNNDLGRAIAAPYNGPDSSLKMWSTCAPAKRRSKTWRSRHGAISPVPIITASKGTDARVFSG